MSYCFVKVTTYYQEYLKNFYARYPFSKQQSYQEQYDQLMADAFGWSDFFSKNLRKLGVEAYEIVANPESLQKAWASEHGLKFSSDWMKSIVLEQLRAYKPDVILFQDSQTFNGGWVKELRSRIPSLKTVIGWCCAPYRDEYMRQFKVFDYMLTCSPLFASEFVKHGMRTYQINHAFEASLLPRVSPNNTYPEIDFVFAGSLFSHHNTRKQVIETLLESGIDLQVYTNLRTISPVRLLAKRSAYLAAGVLKTTGLESLAKPLPGIKKAILWSEFPTSLQYSKVLKGAVHAPIFGLETIRVLSRAKIGFNVHIDVSCQYAGNSRLFEVTGAGACLLTDWKENLHELFELNQEVVSYKSVEECVEKVKWLLDHSVEREAIAKAGQARTLRNHTFKERSEQLDEIIKSNMKTNVRS